MSVPKTLGVSLPSLSTREAITDALLRTVAGIDAQDAELFKSGILQNDECFFEIAGQGVRVQGAAALNAHIINNVIPLATLHQITNVRVEVAGEDAVTARLIANAVAYHYKSEDAFGPENKAFVMAGIYYIDAVKDSDDGLWKCRGWTLHPIWTEGSQTVVFGEGK